MLETTYILNADIFLYHDGANVSKNFKNEIKMEIL